MPEAHIARIGDRPAIRELVTLARQHDLHDAADAKWSDAERVGAGEAGHVAPAEGEQPVEDDPGEAG